VGLIRRAAFLGAARLFVFPCPFVIMPVYRIATWETEYKKAFVAADTEEEAKRIALESLRGERSDVEWDVFDYDGGQIEDIEAI